ncbi:hypothetical protein [Rhizorhapis sp. SPR117]|uniref:hypothetical protein n=1 Tax=Rhizorhapis sp. SPR117 TaxID=2912611 RepID=UPI001F479B8E|nr:hypothetical protein [Rhizorhapis sp. SPR117]
MKFLPAILTAAALALVPASGFAQPGESHSPSIGHSVFMRGTVVRAVGNDLVVCTGSADGAEAGQELTVYRVSEHPHGPKGPPIFQRTQVGTVRIHGVIDEHFANASVVSGTVMRHDIVELQRP